MMSSKAGVHKQTRSVWGNWLLVLILAGVGAFMALPLVYTIVSAFKPMDEIFLFPPRFFVRNPTVNNFTMLFHLASNFWVPFERYVFNSFFVSITATAGHVIMASMAAYPLAKHKFKGREFIFSVVMLALLFSSSVTYIPQYIIMSKLGLINTYGALIFPAFASTLGLFLMKQFMETVPDAILESARIDGAGEFRILWKIVMPQVKPAWLTLTVFAFQATWNITGTSFIYDERLKGLPTMLAQVSGGGIARVGVGAAASLLLLIPPVLTFVITQSGIIETMAHSGIKE